MFVNCLHFYLVLVFSIWQFQNQAIYFTTGELNFENYNDSENNKEQTNLGQICKANLSSLGLCDKITNKIYLLLFTYAFVVWLVTQSE